MDYSHADLKPEQQDACPLCAATDGCAHLLAAFDLTFPGEGSLDAGLVGGALAEADGVGFVLDDVRAHVVADYAAKHVQALWNEEILGWVNRSRALRGYAEAVSDAVPEVVVSSGAVHALVDLVTVVEMHADAVRNCLRDILSEVGVSWEERRPENDAFERPGFSSSWEYWWSFDPEEATKQVKEHLSGLDRGSIDCAELCETHDRVHAMGYFAAAKIAQRRAESDRSQSDMAHRRAKREAAVSSEMLRLRPWISELRARAPGFLASSTLENWSLTTANRENGALAYTRDLVAMLGWYFGTLPLPDGRLAMIETEATIQRRGSMGLLIPTTTRWRVLGVIQDCETNPEELALMSVIRFRSDATLITLCARDVSSPEFEAIRRLVSEPAPHLTG